MNDASPRTVLDGPRLIAAATLVVVVALTFPPWLTMVARGDRTARSQALAGISDSRDPGYAAFLENVRDRTDRGASIAVVAPPGPQQGFYVLRAEWYLAGRHVLPFFDPLTGKPHPERIEDSDLVLFWRLRPSLDRLELVMQDGDGALLRKRP